MTDHNAAATTDELADASRSMNEIMDELRDVHGEPVHEGEDMTVFADEHGHELNDLADAEDVDGSALSAWMHEQARDVHGRDDTPHGGDPWSVADPVVVLHE